MKTPMTNFKRYKRNLTLEKFADLILFDCDVCPAHPCMDEVPDDPDVCTQKVIEALMTMKVICDAVEGFKKKTNENEWRY